MAAYQYIRNHLPEKERMVKGTAVFDFRLPLNASSLAPPGSVQRLDPYTVAQERILQVLKRYGIDPIFGLWATTDLVHPLDNFKNMFLEDFLLIILDDGFAVPVFKLKTDQTLFTLFVQANLNTTIQDGNELIHRYDHRNTLRIGIYNKMMNGGVK